ncbi:MAG: hypothetical protein KIT84_12105 [Labilithrix sp.]|nr:hypothetical protein [Labilithrix sp.]MCW5811755.1 hypothetical protein [Labilithrix sp.]
MSTKEIARLLKDAEATMKRDAKSAVATLQEAYAIAVQAGNDGDTAYVAEELAKGWARRKKSGKALYFAIKATKLAPNERATWTTLGKTCELVASRQKRETKARRVMALYQAAAAAFKKAASMTKDAEDKHFLLELAKDAAKQGKGEVIPPPRQG